MQFKPVAEIVSEYGAIRAFIAKHPFIVPLACAVAGFVIGAWLT